MRLAERRNNALNDRLGFFLFFFFGIFFSLDGRLEVADAFAQALAERRELAGAKQQERNGYNEEDLSETDFAFHKRVLPESRGKPWF
jgi:5-bromo-4-chloroindolyl phosphate hydrolysis protein